MDNNSSDIKDYLNVLLRRKALILGVAGGIMFATLAFSYAMPDMYQSTATIEIDQPEVPDDVIRQASDVTYLDRQVEILTERALIQRNLVNLVKKFDLYPEKHSHMELGEIAGEMRADIRVQMVTTTVTDPLSGRDLEVFVAFTISYFSRSPKSAQQVASDLAQIFLDENYKMRTERVSGTMEFLRTEAEKWRTRIEELESKLSVFKQKYPGQLPEQLDANLNILDRTERELEDAERQIRTLSQDRIFQMSQLQQIDPYLAGTEADQVATLQSEYARMVTIYSPDHPDLIRVRKQLELMTGGAAGNLASLQEELAKTQSELDAARQKYSEDHPDVKKYARAVETLQQRITNAAQVKQPEVPPTNPAYIQTKARLDSIDSEIGALRAKSESLRQKLTNYEKRVSGAPEVERELLTMTRDLENARTKYSELLDKQSDTELQKALAINDKGDRFRLANWPAMPTEPAKPARLAISVLGFMLACTFGIGSAVVAEFMDNTVRGSKDVARLLDAPPLAVIPRVRNAADLRRHRLKLTAASATTFAGVLIIVLLAQLSG